MLNFCLSGDGFLWHKGGAVGFALHLVEFWRSNKCGDFFLQNHWLEILTLELQPALCIMHCGRQSCCWLGRETWRQTGINTFTGFVHLCCLHTHGVPELALYKLLDFQHCITESISVFLYNFLYFHLRPKPICHLFLFYLNWCNCSGVFVSFKQFALKSWVTNGLNGAESAAVSKHKQILICSSHPLSRGLK